MWYTMRYGDSDPRGFGERLVFIGADGYAYERTRQGISRRFPHDGGCQTMGRGEKVTAPSDVRKAWGERKARDRADLEAAGY